MWFFLQPVYLQLVFRVDFVSKQAFPIQQPLLLTVLQSFVHPRSHPKAPKNHQYPKDHCFFAVFFYPVGAIVYFQTPFYCYHWARLQSKKTCHTKMSILLIKKSHILYKKKCQKPSYSTYFVWICIFCIHRRI